MSDDIVERLRAWDQCANGGPLPNIPAVRNSEAAAEVERLRARLAGAEATSLARYESLHAADKRLAEAERNEVTLLGMIRHQRDVLRECLPYINESMAGRRPGRNADDIRAAVKALTADTDMERKP